MIEDVCGRVADWAAQNGGQDPEEVAVADRPFTDDQGPAIVAWLFAIRPGPTIQDDGGPAYRATCRFLITAADARAERCHRWVGALLTAAMQHPTFEVEPDEPPLSLWEAAGMPPTGVRPARRGGRPRAAAVAATRTVPDHCPARHAGGHVRPSVRARPGAGGGGGGPIGRARACARTDRDGRFHLASVPSGHARKLEVRAGAEQYAVTAERTGQDEPLIIHLQAKES
ncbi:MAG: hypothetical protein U5K81_07080 [Trueperaceae bacterium]|nr:hypothetical protein [Trueperaceae bacterium]